MIELKKEINGFCERVGEATKYPLDFEDKKRAAERVRQRRSKI